MGNKDAKKTTSLIDQERTRQANQRTNIYEPERAEERKYATGLRDEIAAGYRDFAGGKFSGGGGGGSVSLDPIYGELEPRYRELSQNLEKAAPGYEEFSKTGGLTSDNINRIRGLGVYDELAKTGGYSDIDRSNIRARGISPISSIYGNLQNDMARRRAVTGGYSPGFGGTASKLARESSIASGRAALDTELGLSDAIRSGRLAGAGGISSSEQGLADITQRGRLAGLSGLESLGKFGYGGLTDVAGARQSVAAQNASAGASNAAYNDRMRLAGLSGLESLYGSSPGELSRYDAMVGPGGATSRETAYNLGQRMENVGPQVSAWDRATGLIGAGASAAAPWLGRKKK